MWAEKGDRPNAANAHKGARNGTAAAINGKRRKHPKRRLEGGKAHCEQRRVLDEVRRKMP